MNDAHGNPTLSGPDGEVSSGAAAELAVCLWLACPTRERKSVQIFALELAAWWRIESAKDYAMARSFIVRDDDGPPYLAAPEYALECLADAIYCRQSAIALEEWVSRCRFSTPALERLCADLADPRLAAEDWLTGVVSR